MCNRSTRTSFGVTYTAPELPNMTNSRVNGIRGDQYSPLGRETVGRLEPVVTQEQVDRNGMQMAFASVLLDQLEDYGAAVKEHRRRLGNRCKSARSQRSYNPSISFQEI